MCGTASIIRNSLIGKEWKFVHSDNNLLMRTLRIGNTLNCNGELLRNEAIKYNIEAFFATINLNIYYIKTIDTKFEYSFDIIIPEDEYKKLKLSFQDTDNQNDGIVSSNDSV